MQKFFLRVIPYHFPRSSTLLLIVATADFLHQEISNKNKYDGEIQMLLRLFILI